MELFIFVVQDRRVFLSGCGRMIGGIGLEVFPVLGIFRIAVLRNPARSGKKLGVTAHVDQRDRAEQHAETLWITGQHVRDGNAAI